MVVLMFGCNGGNMRISDRIFVTPVYDSGKDAWIGDYVDFRGCGIGNGT